MIINKFYPRAYNRDTITRLFYLYKNNYIKASKFYTLKEKILSHQNNTKVLDKNSSKEL